jgi:hypothetical protein
MAILEELYIGIQQCVSTKTGVTEWERAVALFVGSIEGSERGGRDIGDGATLYALSKELCSLFDKCEGSGDAAINEALLNAFEDGKELLEENDCDGARAIIKSEILGALPVPLIQGTLFYAYNNANLDVGTDSQDYASGAALANSLLPLVKNVNATSDATISANMKFDLTAEPVKDGSNAVYEAFQFALPTMGVDCTDIGTYKEISPCNASAVPPEPEIPTESDNKSKAGLIVGILVGVAAVGGIAFFLVRRRQRRKAETEKPLFVTNGDGEMNHDTDILGGKFSSYRDDPHEPYLDDHNGDYHDGALNQTAESLGSVGSLFSDQAPIV